MELLTMLKLLIIVLATVTCVNARLSFDIHFESRTVNSNGETRVHLHEWFRKNFLKNQENVVACLEAELGFKDIDHLIFTREESIAYFKEDKFRLFDTPPALLTTRWRKPENITWDVKEDPHSFEVAFNTTFVNKTSVITIKNFFNDPPPLFSITKDSPWDMEMDDGIKFVFGLEEDLHTGNGKFRTKQGIDNDPRSSGKDIGVSVPVQYPEYLIVQYRKETRTVNFTTYLDIEHHPETAFLITLSYIQKNHYYHFFSTDEAPKCFKPKQEAFTGRYSREKQIDAIPRVLKQNP